MASKLKKVINTVKDQTSISLALVALRGSSTTLEVAVLKATSHDEVPVNDRYATEVLLLASSSPSSAAATALALRRRISKTSNWVVALKTLTVIYTTLVDAGPDFRREAAMHHLLDLSSFRSTPWDFTAFVRTYALYLDARLQSSLQGYISLRRRRRRPADVKPAIMLDRIQHWQQLLDRAVGTRPTGPAKENRLVQISLCSVVHDSFYLYDDVAGGVSLLLDNFVQLPYPLCVATVEACRKTAKLFEDLDEFYVVCKKIGVGRDSEYPTVQKISKKLLAKLNGHLKNHQDYGDPTSDTADSPPKLLQLTAESMFRTNFMRRGSSMAEIQNSPDRVMRRGSSMAEMQSSPDSGMMRRGSSMAEMQSSPDSVARPKSLNPFLDDEPPSPTHRTASLRMDLGTEKEQFRTASAREEDMGIQRNSFDKSAWIQKHMDEGARQRMRREQEQWMQHQNRFIERNLAFL